MVEFFAKYLNKECIYFGQHIKFEEKINSVFTILREIKEKKLIIEISKNNFKKQQS